MTPIFCCGFECGQIGTVGQHWAPQSATIDTTTVRNGVRSLKCNPSAAMQYAESSSGGTNTVWVARVAVRFATLPNSNTTLLFGASTFAGAYFKASDSKIYPGYGAASMGTTGIAVTTGQWYILNVRVNVSANPWTIDVRVDSTDAAQFTRAIAASSDSIIRLGFQTSTTAEAYFDDFVMSATSADYPIGDGYVNHFVPTSDGTHNVAGANDFDRGDTGVDINNATTDAYLLIDDVPIVGTTPDETDDIRCTAPPNATDYVECVFGPAPGISTPTTAPRAVEAIVAHHEVGTGLGTHSTKLNDNGTEATIGGLTSEAGATTTRYYRAHFATMPADAGAWTAARFNNLRVRFGYSSDANPDQMLDSAMIEAEFAATPTSAVSRRIFLIN